MVVAGLFLGSLLGKLLRGQVISAVVLLDEEVFHNQNENGRNGHHAGADGVASNIPVSCILSSVDLTTNGASDVSEGDNGSSCDTTLGVASNVSGEPPKI